MTTSSIEHEMSSIKNAEYKYGAIARDVESDEQFIHNPKFNHNGAPPEPKKLEEEQRNTYDVPWTFKIVSGLVWFSMSVWGTFIVSFFGQAFLFDWNKFNTFGTDLYNRDYPVASLCICIHLVGASFMMIAGCVQLVKYIRRVYPAIHRWVGRLYIFASLLVSVGGSVYVIIKGGGPGESLDASITFLIEGTMTFLSSWMTLYYGIKKQFKWHKLWAWRLYALQLGAWLYRFMYYYLKVYQGRPSSMSSGWDEVINWCFLVPPLVVVEIVFRWGETAKLPHFVARILDVVYGIAFVLVVWFTIHMLFYFYPRIYHFHSPTKFDDPGFFI